MKRLKLFSTFVIVYLILSFGNVKAQCPTDLLQGQNLVTNSDFSNDYTGWTHHSDYSKFSSGWSVPGNIYVGTNPFVFNNAFLTYDDHTPSSTDNKFLMVDGICNVGIPLWSQSGIPIKPNTTYYFGVWISSLKDNPTNQGHLRFDINGTNLLTDVAAPVTGGSWIFYETFWASGPTPPATVTISIENTTTTGCATEVDFAIDDISFIPGCTYTASQATPKPDLGPDRTICGTGGSITLNAGVPMTAGTTVTWWDGVTNTGSNPAYYSRTITAPGTYSVCVNSGGSCTVADYVTISNTYSINIGPDQNLCYPPSTSFDAVFSGTGVTYQWYREQNSVAGWQAADTLLRAKGKTYTVNTPGTYMVQVTDPVCGVRTDEANVTTSAASPVNGSYCTGASSVAVTGPGTYRWYNTPTKGSGTLLASGNTYNVPAASLVAPNDYTYYVEDITTTTGSVGPTTLMGGIQDWGSSGNEDELQLRLSITRDVQINSLKIPYRTYGSTATGTVTVELRDGNGVSFAPAKIFTSTATNVPNNSGTTTLYQFNFSSMLIQRTWGTDFRLVFVSQGGGINGAPQWNDNVSPAYPYASSPSGIMEITGSGGTNATNADYIYFYDIRFTASAPCDRVPVYMFYSCPLPVELVNFNAKDQSKNILLIWTTAMEENNHHFNIERSSDGSNFEVIGQVDGHGTTSSMQNYAFVDQHPLNGSNYYRLVQYDMDGRSSNSKIIHIRRGTHEEVVVRPNPASDVFNVSFMDEAGAEVKLSLYNSFGQMVHSEIITSTSENFSKDVSLAHQMKGIYVLHLEGPTHTSVMKIVKE